MSDMGSFSDEGQGSIRGLALPPLLLGLAIALGALIRTDVWYQLPAWQLYLSAGLPLAAGGLVVGVGLWALIRGLPLWGITWVAAAFMGGALFLQTVVDEMIDEGALVLAPWLQAVMLLVVLIIGLILLLAAARSGWRPAGLFTMSAAFTLGISLLQSITAAPMNRDDLALLAAPVGMVMAGLLFAYLIGSDRLRIGVIVLAGLVNTGAVLGAILVWRASLGLQVATAAAVPLMVILTVLLLSGPVLGYLINRTSLA